MIRVLGVGNPLMGDDGVGIAVVEQLWREPLPEGVEVVDAGTGGLDLAHLIDDAEGALLVDAVNMGAEPGALRWLTAEDVQQGGEPFHISLHETRLGPLLRWLGLLGNCPPVWILGIQPARVQPGRGLSPAVERAVPQAVRRIGEWLAIAQQVGIADGGWRGGGDASPPACAPFPPSAIRRPQWRKRHG